MASTIIQAATSTSGLVSTAGNDGSLQIQVGNNPASPVNALTFDTAGNASFAGGIVPATPFSFRNRIINGDFRVSQYNGATAVTPAGAGAYVIDRWLYSASQASKLTMQQVADAPIGAKYSEKISVAAQYAPITSDYFTFLQKIEGQNIIDFAFGTSSALSITTSYWIKTSVAGAYSVNICNGSFTRSYVATYTIPTANVWTQLKLTISGDQTGTWATDNTSGLQLTFDLGTGATYATTTTNAWQAGNFVKASGTVDFVNQVAGSTWQIANVQMEAGTVATPFELRPIGTELALCQRYARYLTYSQYEYAGVGVNTGGTTVAYLVLPIAVPLRVNPTVAVINGTYNGVVITSAFSTYSCLTNSGLMITLSGSGMTPNSALPVYGATAAGMTISLHSEL